MTKHSRRFALLTLMTLLAWQPNSSASDLESPEALHVVGAGVCNESKLQLEIDSERDLIFLRRPDGTLWRLDDHVLRVGFGTNLRSVKLEVDVQQAGNWALWVLAPKAEDPSSVPSDSSGTMSVTLMRPSTNGLAWEFGAYLPDTFQSIDPALPVPDLVIEPQTGCPPDTDPL